MRFTVTLSNILFYQTILFEQENTCTQLPNDKKYFNVKGTQNDFARLQNTFFSDKFNRKY